MKASVLIAAGLFFAFSMGALTASWHLGATETFNVARQTVLTSTSDSAAADNRMPASRSDDLSGSKNARVAEERSGAFLPIEAGTAEDEEGAAVGAVSGVVAGLLYDLVTRHKAGF